MAPSRGFSIARRNLRSNISRGYSTFRGVISNPKNRFQSYISRSRDPYLNLSIEHYILRHSDPDATILFLYVNRPCIVIGRNQNPWIEVNLALLKTNDRNNGKPAEPPGIGDIDLVRRRSGGGTVFHDEGNVNWSIICPPAAFTRDKHAEMVVRALRENGIERARVNDRHDIVLDQGPRRSGTLDSEDMHRTAYMTDGSSGLRPLKISGSAYKLTRARSLHHGTCLLSSPNLNIIPHYLHSPAKPFIKARGVESVSSPVSNVGLDTGVFQESVQLAYASMYGLNQMHSVVVGEEQLGIPEIAQDYHEMQTPDWLYCQTPQFTLSSNLGDMITSPSILDLSLTDFSISSKHGRFTEVTTGTNVQPSLTKEISQIEGKRIHELNHHLKQNPVDEGNVHLWRWLLSMLPAPF